MTDTQDTPERTTLQIPDPRGEHSEDLRDIDAMDSTDPPVEVESLPHEATTRKLPRLRPPIYKRLSPLMRPVQVLVPVAKRRGWQRWAWMGVLLAMVVVLVIVVLQSRLPQVKYARVTTGNLTLRFTTVGTLQSASYEASFSSSGKLAEIDVRVGQQVSQGTPLAKLDTTQLQDALNEAQSTVNSAQTQLGDAQAAQQRMQAQTAANIAAAYDQEQHAMQQCGASDGACLQRAQDAYAAAQAQADTENANAQSAVDAAQAALSAAQAKAKTAQDNLSGATLPAPHGGTIAAINGAIGGTVIGSNANAPEQPFIVIADLGALQVVSSVGQPNVAAVAPDNPVQFTVPSVGNQVFQGRVSGVSPVPRSAQGGATLAYPMTIDVDMHSVQNAHLFPGMTANLTVVTQQRFGVKLIPASAVSFARAAATPKEGGFLTNGQVTKALSEARQMQLDVQSAGADISADNPTPGYVLQRNGNTWIVKPVILGLTDGVSYEVLDGLSVGDTVVKGEANGPVAVPTATASASTS